MKTSAIIIFLFVAFQTIVSAQINQNDIFGKKIRSYTRMRNTGIILTTTGGLLSIAGLLIYREGVSTPYKSSGESFFHFDDSDGPEKRILGALSVVGGICTSFTGSIFWTIGSAKKNQYKEKLNSVSLYINPDPRKALTLSLRF